LRTLVPECMWPRHVTLNGTEIPVRGQPFSFGVKRALWNQTYELPERTLISRVLQPGMHVIEFGGSLGIVTAVVAAAVGPSGRVASVEASDRLATIASQWLRPRYPHVAVLHGYGFPTMSLPTGLAVGGFRNDGPSLGGRVQFEIGSEGTSVMQDDAAMAYDLARVMRHADIPAPQVLVCDIEGSELIVTDPSFSLPPSVRYVLMELHPHLYPAGANDEKKIITALDGAGFQPIGAIGASHLFERCG
jgi:hypothetical protein